MSFTKQTKQNSSFLTRRAALTTLPGAPKKKEATKQRKEDGRLRRGLRFEKGGSI